MPNEISYIPISLHSHTALSIWGPKINCEKSLDGGTVFNICKINLLRINFSHWYGDTVQNLTNTIYFYIVFYTLKKELSA